MAHGPLRIRRANLGNPQLVYDNWITFPLRQVRVVMGHRLSKGFPQIKVDENEGGMKLALGKDQLGTQDLKAQRAKDPLRSLPEMTGS